MDTVWTFANNSSLWFTSCLSIFYLLKIANISHPFFFWLKLKINKVILAILLGSFLISLIISIPINDDMWCHLFKVSHEENITWASKVSTIPGAFKQLTLNLGATVPFILCLISFFLLLFFLVRHTKQIQLHATGFRDPSTEAHMRAVKTVIIFLLLLIVYYPVFLVMTSNALIPQGKLVLMIGDIVTVIFPSSHSFILIMGNSKLREAFLKMLRFVKGFLRKRKPFGP
ncbi:PREDICTED: taste receptor type 2 member 9 [Colobus angolensis palliatus]|uniref:taste receptor type 2 member 9 n=1 Tax=Colobus angolensis palliatus TaxID=336983 RepID=UPI0005F5421A|nr:PREDICTED: taste receptor type 2 member 9 [Colobus angolensis palliatus]